MCIAKVVELHIYSLYPGLVLCFAMSLGFLLTRYRTALPRGPHAACGPQVGKPWFMVLGFALMPFPNFECFVLFLVCFTKWGINENFDCE